LEFRRVLFRSRETRRLTHSMTPPPLYQRGAPRGAGDFFSLLPSLVELPFAHSFSMQAHDGEGNEQRRHAAFPERAKAELDSLEAQVNRYRTEFHQGQGAVDARRLEEVEAQREALRRRSEDLEGFDGDAWQRAKDDVEEARRRLRETLERGQDSRPRR